MKKDPLSVTHSELAKQIHPDSLIKADEVTHGSKKKPLWVCGAGHTWEAAVFNRVRGVGCGKCASAILANKTLAVTHPELAKQIHPDSPIQAHEVTYGSTRKPLWICDEGHTWRATVSDRARGKMCRTCYYSKPHPNKKTLNLTHPELAAQIHSDSPLKADEVTAGSAREVLWVCKEGHMWRVAVFSRTAGFGGCPTCREVTPIVKSLAVTHPELAAQIHLNSPVKAHEVTAGSSKKPLWVCALGHTWYKRVNDRTAGFGGCPTCREVTPIVKSLAATHPKLAAQIHSDSPIQAHEVTYGSMRKPLWVCDGGHTWEAAAPSRIRGNGCPECASSQGERDVRDYLTTLLPIGMSVVANTRTIIPPLELDMYIPALRLAVEYNGTYWHSDEVILATRGITADEYHNNKKRRCEEQGVTLIFVEEQDWKTNPQHVKQRLQDAVTATMSEACLNPV